MQINNDTAKLSPIGVFDSGVGGLTAVSELTKILPNEDIIYLGDTARVPYGNRSHDTILKFASQDLDFLKRQGVKLIIAACGTVSSVMLSATQSGVLFTGVIRPAVETAARSTKNKKIGVIATDASIKSRSYENLLKQRLDGVQIFAKACPMFVPLVENGYISRDCLPTSIIAKEYLEPLRNEGIDTLILGCTHYPLIADIITDTVGTDVKLISSGAEAGKFAKQLLKENGLLNDRGVVGTVKFYCTDSPELFRESAARFLNLGNAEVEKCTLEP